MSWSSRAKARSAEVEGPPSQRCAAPPSGRGSLDSLRSLGMTQNPDLYDVSSPVRILESRPRAVARAGHALNAQRELRGARGVEDGALVRDDAARVVLHERL